MLNWQYSFYLLGQVEEFASLILCQLIHNLKSSDCCSSKYAGVEGSFARKCAGDEGSFSRTVVHIVKTNGNGCSSSFRISSAGDDEFVVLFYCGVESGRRFCK